MAGGLSLMLMASGCASAGTSQNPFSTVEGVASYRERIALPAEAVFEATIEDITRADAPAKTVGRTVVEAPRTPVRFTIEYDPASVRPERIYSVRAQIRVGDALWFTSDRVHRVITGGTGHSVVILLKRVGGGQPRPTTAGGDDAWPLPAHGLRLPATFRGDLPCADCYGIRYHLDLWPDQVFHLRREWLGQDRAFSDVGRWRVDAGRRALILQGGTEMPLQFEILGPDRLRQLDLAGKPIASDLPYELQSDGVLEPADMSLFLGGEMTDPGGSPRFTECLTGRSYAIGAGEEAQRLTRAYLAAVEQPGARLYVTFEGTITRLPGGEDGGPVDTVTVERFIGAWPNQNCSRSRADATPVGTYWRIVQIEGEAVGVSGGRREPNLVLRESGGSRTYAATVGCNQLVGPYRQEGARLTFGRVATTLMACPPPLDHLERRLGEALDAIRGWQILGNTLALRDEAGKELVLLEAVYF